MSGTPRPRQRRCEPNTSLQTVQSGRHEAEMAATLKAAAPGEAGLRPGKRRSRAEMSRTPRAEMEGEARVRPVPVSLMAGERSALDAYKKALLVKEHERECRHVQEAVRRLEEIEELRRKARARKIDREMRKDEFIALVQRSAICLQRAERRRQFRAKIRRRMAASFKLIRWARAKIQRALILKATRNRNVLKIMVDVNELVTEQISEACFLVRNIFPLQMLKRRRAARIIQNLVRKRARAVRRYAAVITAHGRGWLTRARLRRARLRKSILRHRGSMSRRALGLPEAGPYDSSPSIRDESELRKGRWWDVGAPVAPRPRWVDPKVAKNEEEKSRRRAASLADLIRDGAAAVGVGGAAGGVKPSAREIMRAAGVRVGVASEGGVLARGHKRALSMVDAREAEKAAVAQQEVRRKVQEELREAAADKVQGKRWKLREKHLAREREFQLQRERRQEAALKDVKRKEKLRYREMAEAARERELAAELRREKEEQVALGRVDKVRGYKQQKAAKDAAERKAKAGKKAAERRAKELAESKRRAAEAQFVKEKEGRLERARRKRRAEELARAKQQEEKLWGKRKEPMAIQPLAPPLRPSSNKRRGRRPIVVNARNILAPISVGLNSNGEDRRRKKWRRLRGEPNASNVSSDSTKSYTHSPAAVAPVWRDGAMPQDSHANMSGGGENALRPGMRRMVGVSTKVAELGACRNGKGGVAELGDIRKRTKRRARRKRAHKYALDKNGDSSGGAQSYYGGTETASSARGYEGPVSGELLTTETLYSAFPVPGPEAECGGGDGLGATSAEGSLFSGFADGASRQLAGNAPAANGSASSASAQVALVVPPGDTSIDGAVYRSLSVDIFPEDDVSDLSSSLTQDYLQDNTGMATTAAGAEIADARGSSGDDASNGDRSFPMKPENTTYKIPSSSAARAYGAAFSSKGQPARAEAVEFSMPSQNPSPGGANDAERGEPAVCDPCSLAFASTAKFEESIVSDLSSHLAQDQLQDDGNMAAAPNNDSVEAVGDSGNIKSDCNDRGKYGEHEDGVGGGGDDDDSTWRQRQ